MELLHSVSRFSIQVMNAPAKYLTLTLFSATAVLFLAACSKKEDSAPAAQGTEEVAETAKEEASSSGSLLDSAVGAAASLTASDDATKAHEEAAAQAQKQAAAAQAEAEAATEEAKAATAAAQAEVEAAAADAKAQIEEIKAQAAEMYTKYAGEISTLTANASKLADLVEKNIDTLPAGVADKYNEFKELVPEVSSLVDSLKGYQGADLSNIVSKIETDYSKATGLYTEIMSMIPEGLSIPGIKMP